MTGFKRLIRASEQPFEIARDLVQSNNIGDKLFNAAEASSGLEDAARNVARVLDDFYNRTLIDKGVDIQYEASDYISVAYFSPQNDSHQTVFGSIPGIDFDEVDETVFDELFRSYMSNSGGWTV